MGAYHKIVRSMGRKRIIMHANVSMKQGNE